ncbi:MAG TPA: PAS domain S-box protein [Methanomassiliicoccales archaeon]
MSPQAIQILSVDDEPYICDLTKEFLEMSGSIKVDVARSVEEARESIAKKYYDAIVSDYQMPGEDGIRFLKSLRASGDTIPFILFTGKGREEVVIEAINNGADAYLQKGGEPRSLFAELEHRITTIVRRHHAESALLDSESEFRTLFQDNPDSISIVGVKGEVLNCNQAAADMVLLHKEEIIGGSVSDLGVFDQETLELFQKSIIAMMKGLPTSPIVARVHRKDGTIRWVELRSSGIRKGSKCDAFQVIARDITERKRSEQSLKQNNEELNAVNQQLAAAQEELRKQLKAITEGQEELKREKALSETLVESLPGIFYLYNGQTMRMVNWNKNHREVSGYSDEEMLDKHVFEWFRPEDAKAALDDIETCMSEGKTSFETQLVMKDGREVPYLLTSSRLDTKEGTFFMGVGIDVTERRELDKHMTELNRELGEKEDRLRRLMEQSFDAIITHQNGKIVQANETASMLMGARSVEDHLGRSVSEFAGPGSEGIIEHRMNFLYANPGTVAPLMEEKFRRLNGGVIDVEVMATSYLEDGKPTAQVIFRDITERKRLEKELRESEEFHRHLMSNLSIGVVIIDPVKRTIESVNEAAAAMLGCDEREMVGDVCHDYLCPGLNGVCPVCDSGMEVKNLERTLMCADGSNRPILKTVKKISIHGKERMLECFMDITEREKAQSALRETNKKLNLLSNITRHDINNQLIVLTGYLGLMESVQNASAAELYLAKAQKAAERISAMIQFTKTYEDIGIHAPSWQNVHELVEKCSADLHLGGIEIVNDLPRSTEIFADPLISKVFLNLIQNAKIHGGDIKTIRFSVDDRDGSRAIICEDDGVGIQSDIKEKLFTKGFGKGHGFGLFLSREILSITGIDMTEQGMTGKGAKFVISVPVSGIRGA